jgi:uncharacterized FlaG/YvyC family protein
MVMSAVLNHDRTMQNYNSDLLQDLLAKKQQRDSLDQSIKNDISQKEGLDIAINRMHTENERLIHMITEMHHRMAEINAKIKNKQDDRTALDKILADSQHH